MRLTVIGFLLVFSSVLSRAQAPRSPAPHRHVVTVSSDNQHGSEPSIAVNPNNPSQVVAVFQPATVVYSSDGGETFRTADLLPIEGWRTGGDVSITFDNKGRAYLSTLHFEKLGSMCIGRMAQEKTVSSCPDRPMAEKHGKKMRSP